jgi:hypothetical protein
MANELRSGLKDLSSNVRNSKRDLLHLKKRKLSSQKNVANLIGRSADSELAAVKQYGDRLKAQEREVLASLRSAKEAGDLIKKLTLPIS